MTTLKAIIDTNVVFEGLTKSGGAPGLIIDAWAAGLFKACVSNALSCEYEEVLSRKLANIRWLIIKPALGALLDKAEFVTVWYTWRPSSPDPGDDHLIDCALNSGGIIITSNQGVPLEHYILFALTRQISLTPAIRKVAEKDAECQHKDFTERIKRLGNASPEELEKVLADREPVEPEPGLKQQTVLRLKNRIAQAKNAS